MWRQKMSYLSEKGLDLEQRKKFYFGLIEKYNLTIAVAEKFRNAFSICEMVRNDDVIFGDAWEKGLSKRPTTRDIYEHTAVIPSQYVTPEALKIINDKMLDPEQKTKFVTNDHLFSPQTMSYFVLDNWHEIFSENLDLFFKEMKMWSTTILTTVKENNILKKFTVNNKETGNRIKLKVKTQDRYKAAGITKLWAKDEGRYVDGFPFDLSEDFLKYEEDYLLI